MGWAHRWRPPGGEGYGGEAKGARTTTMKPPFDAANQPPAEHKRIGHMEAKEYREKLREKHAKALQAYDDAWASDNPAVKMVATKQWEARMYGEAKQIIETTDVPKTREELLAEVEAAKKEAGLA